LNTKPLNILSDDLDAVLDRTKPMWEGIRGSRIFIAGGTGFFGCWLLESFAWANEKLDLRASVTALTRNPDAFHRKAPHLCENPAIELLPGDVRTFDFPKGPFSHVVNAVVDSSSDNSLPNPLRMMDTVVTGTRRTLDLALSCGAEKYLYTSTGAIYGNPPQDMALIPETFFGDVECSDPARMYNETRRFAEMLCAVYASQSSLKVKTARGFAFVGPYLPLDGGFAAGNFIRDAMNGGPIIVKGDGSPLRSYLYAADLAEWLWTILFKGQSSRPYNLGSEEAISIRDLAYLVADVFGGVEVSITGNPNSGVAGNRYVPATERARSELGLEQRTSLRDSIERTVRWHKQRASMEE
jgi:dTDP-glucose 4,6-dehydratase